MFTVTQKALAHAVGAQDPNQIAVKYLEKGTHGSVFSVQHKNTTFAVKVTKQSDVDTMREIAMLESLKDKCDPYVVCFKSAHKHDDTGLVYIVTEFLGDYCEMNKLEKLKNGLEKLKIGVWNAIEGLRFLHNLGYAHRDVKSENLFVNKNTGQVKFIDFGAACIKEECKSERVGTPEFRSWELYEEKDSDPFKADIWALGMTLYESFGLTQPIDLLLQITADSITPKRERAKMFATAYEFFNYKMLTDELVKLGQADVVHEIMANDMAADKYLRNIGIDLRTMLTHDPGMRELPVMQPSKISKRPRHC